MLLNVGPSHPSTHGVLRVLVELDGELINSADPDIGYLHRGIEKMCEYRTYHKCLPLMNRVDYLAGEVNNFGFCLAVEKLLGRRGPQAGPVYPGADRGVDPDRLPPLLAGDPRPRPGGHDPAVLRLPRAGKDHGPVRNGLRGPDVPALFPHRRPGRGPARGLHGRRPGSSPNPSTKTGRITTPS